MRVPETHQEQVSDKTRGRGYHEVIAHSRTVAETHETLEKTLETCCQADAGVKHAAATLLSTWQEWSVD